LNDYLRDFEQVSPTTWSSYDPLSEIRRDRLNKAQAFELARRALALPPEEPLPPEGVESLVHANFVSGTITGLARFGSDAIPLIQAALSHWSPFVRLDAMGTLRYLQASSSVPLIADIASKDPVLWVRGCALRELSYFSKSLVGKYEYQIANNLGVRIDEICAGNWVETFLKCRAPHGLEILQKAATSSDPMVAQDAKDGLSHECNEWENE
jgi:hypothetical protein